MPREKILSHLFAVTVSNLTKGEACKDVNWIELAEQRLHVL
jgi:hypothetical protein